MQLTLSEYLVYNIAFDLLLFAMYVEIPPVFWYCFDCFFFALPKYGIICHYCLIAISGVCICKQGYLLCIQHWVGKIIICPCFNLSCLEYLCEWIVLWCFSRENFYYPLLLLIGNIPLGKIRLQIIICPGYLENIIIGPIWTALFWGK